jgi:hypothetical protein
LSECLYSEPKTVPLSSEAPQLLMALLVERCG